MPSIKKSSKKSSQKSPFLSLSWQGQLQDYVTAMDWSPDGTWLAIASGAGEVALLNVADRQTIVLEPAGTASVDCLGFSYDGKFLAAGGQTGQVKIWQIPHAPPQDLKSAQPSLLKVLEHPRTWVERLAWSPTRHELAFGLGRYVQVWDAASDQIVSTLPFETSSALDLAWHPDGEQLAVSGHLSVKIWSRSEWDDDPVVQALAAAGLAIAISPDGQYLASGNLDNTLVVWGWRSPHPWRMTGFPGKVSHLAWANATRASAPIIAVASGAGLIVWRKLRTDEAGWASRAFDLHHKKIVALAFQPGSSLLASAGEDGRVILWRKAKSLSQILEGANQGFSTLAWNPQGNLLAAGAAQGEWLIWAKSDRGKGFLR
ncbi:MAG: WD40 repeat domain-containing protein [Cyanobacteria bacterium P01_A01_bin.116]